jgi:hypothetical protein
MPPVGHAAYWEAPDQPYRDPIKAAEASIAVYQTLRDFGAIVGTDTPGVDADVLLLFLHHNFQTINDEDEALRAQRWFDLLRSEGLPVPLSLPSGVYSPPGFDERLGRALAEQLAFVGKFRLSTGKH